MSVQEISENYRMLLDNLNADLMELRSFSTSAPGNSVDHLIESIEDKIRRVESTMGNPLEL